MSSYIDTAINDTNMTFVYIVLLMFFFFVNISLADIQQRFIFTLLIAFITYQYYLYTVKQLKSKADIKEQFSKNESELKTKKEMLVNNVYSIHQSPAKFKYIYYHSDIMSIVNNLKFMTTFDKAAYDAWIILLEKFLKIYCYMLDKRYPCKPWHQTLIDLRSEILNLMMSFHHNIPDYSTKYHKETRSILDDEILKIQSITYKCLRVITHKCNKMIGFELLNYKAPLPFDNTKNNKYDVF